MAIGWLVYELTGSALEVGLAQFLPVALLTLVVGHVADRYDRRRIVGCCQIVEAVASASLAIGTASGRLPVGGVFAIVALIGAARAFESPTLSALMPGLVGESRLQQASAWSASANQTATILGPAFGGLLYALGDAIPFALATVLFLVASTLVFSIRLERPVPPKEAPTLRSVFGGIHFIWEHPAVLGAISLDLFAVLLGGATALLPIYARDIVVSVVIRFALVQMRTPDAMRGRVSAVNMLFIGTSNQLGEFESGTTAALLGTVPAALLGGLGTIVVALLWMRWFPSLRKVDELS